MKILTEHIEVPGIETIDVYRKHGGYQAVEKALKKMTPDEVTEEVKKSGLRGRGGAGFPVGMKWSFLAKPEGVPRYLVCNADESEPGTFKDHYLMWKSPHTLIEGMIVSSYALGANTSYIYVRGELMYVIYILEKAIQEAYDKGLLGKNILGSGYDLDLYVQSGGGAYICGEETALLESLEGKRGNPRNKPPFPAVKGLWQCPTVVNNVESISATSWIVNNGGDAYAQIGVGRSTGTKLISASGHIRKPGVYEIPLGITVEDFIYSDEWCGGIRDGHKLKAVVAGGSSVPILPAELILTTAAGEKRLMTYESLSDGGFATGTMLGSGGFIVMDETTCIVHNTLTFARFYHHESCGQCSPCREGTGWMDKVIKRIEMGQGRKEDIDLLVDVAKKIEGNTICPLGDAAAWPVAAAIRHFRDEFEWHIEHPELATQPGAVYMRPGASWSN
ncbi:NADH-quinone oxidoreductase subunit NuoF [Aquirufa rosea]|uniref:NADH-quinone oxidoreductase subunit F n=1 Tax=Aquirufa rosea TaxID=2509241 RepID=A0A4Q1C0W6_9BACT|nr:NADH-quinone oxidoreductase subunit NuoF [Aquirufa rosea]RXK50736.1 NADH oxidoreductase (quinone) subunit F [Aquirufa rosea]